MSRRPTRTVCCEPLEPRWMLAAAAARPPEPAAAPQAVGGWSREVELSDLVNGQILRVESPGVLRVTPGGAATGAADLRLALLDDRGRLLVASADPAGGVPETLRQFVRPGDYVLAAKLSAPAAGGLTVEFTPGESPVLPVAVGELPASVAAADLDGDRVLDLLVANLGSLEEEDPNKGALEVLFGVGDGSFRRGESIRVGDNPENVAVAAAGPAGAGLMAVTANPGGDSVSVVRISAGGAFAAPLSIPVGRAPTAVALADVDGDGRTDIVVANSATGDTGPLPDATGSCSVLLQTAAGGFVEVARLLSGYNPGGVAVGDLDTDGLPEIVVTHPDSNDVVVFRRTADGGFDAPTPPIHVGGNPSAVALADVDGDGLTDIVVANSYSADVSIVRQSKHGGFADPDPPLPVGTSPYAVRVADVDGDGRADILTANQNSNDVSVLLGLGGGAFLPPTSVATGSYPSGLAVGHFDADHTLDLVTADLNDGTVSLLRGFGDGGFLERRRLSAGSFPYDVAVGDVNGDGRPDLVTANRESSDLSVLLGRGDGSFGKRRTLPLADVALSPIDVRLVDINGDGRLDIVTANEGLGTSPFFREPVVPGGVCILFGLGDGSFTPPQVELVNEHPSAVAVADLNGDTLPDIVVTVGRPVEWEQGSTPYDWRPREIPPGAVYVLMQQFDGSFAARPAAAAVGRQPTDVVVTDLDGDRAADIVVCATGFAGFDDLGGAAVMYGDGRGGFAPPLGLAAGSHPQSLAVADVDGDTRPDIVVVNSNRHDRGENGDLSVLRQEGRRRFVPEPVRRPVGLLPYGILIDDVSDDGKPDIVVSNVAGKSISVLAGDGAGGFADAVSLPWLTAAPGGLASGDIDRDGRTDLVTANLVTNDVTVVLQSGWITLGDLPNPFQAGVSQGVGLLAPAGSRPGGTVTVDRGGRVIVRRGGGVSVVPSGTFALCSLASRDGAVRFAAVDAGRGTVSIQKETAEGRLAVVQRFAAAAPDEDHPTRSVLMRVVSMDLDGDGWGDLVVSNPGAGTVDVLVSGADGSFDPAAWQRLDAGVGPARILVADVSGDDVPDLVVTNQVSGQVSVRLGVAGVLGTGGFTAATGFGPEDRVRTSGLPYGFATDPVSRKVGAIAPFTLTDVAVGDVDGDGRPDIVAVNSEARSFAVLAGTGGGGFAAAREHRVVLPAGADGAGAGRSIEVHDVAVGRFDADEKADLALLDRSGERLLIYLGGGLARSREPAAVVSLAGNLPRSISVADATGPNGVPDGILDILVGNDYGDVLTLQGVGDGSFKSYVRADRSVALLAADVDGDGKDDFIYGSKGLDRIWLKPTATPESFQADRRTGVLGPSAVATVAETIGGRTYRNLVVANGGANQLLLFSADRAAAGSGSVFLPEPRTFYVGTNPSAVVVEDVNGDGVPDVVVANEGSNDVSLMLGVTDAAGRWTMIAGPRLSSAGTGPAGVAVSDFVGGDGVPDIAVTNRGSNSVAILRGLAGGFFNDVSPTFLPLSIPAPGPIVPLPRPGLPPLLVVGSAANQFQTFGRSGSGFTASAPVAGFGSSLATVTVGRTGYLAAGNTAGGVAIFLGGTSALTFHAVAKSLPGLTGLSFDSAGRLFGVSPASGGALNLFSFSPAGQAPQTALTAAISQAQSFVTRLVFTPLKAAGVGLVATLVTANGARLAGRPSEPAPGKPDRAGEPDGGSTEEEPRGEGDEPAAEAEGRAEESNPLLDFVLDLEGLLRLQNRRLTASLFAEPAAEPAGAGAAAARDGGAVGREANAAEPAAAARPAGGRPESADPSAAIPPEPSGRHADDGSSAGDGGSVPALPSRRGGPPAGEPLTMAAPALRPPEATADRRLPALIDLVRAVFASLQAG